MKDDYLWDKSGEPDPQIQQLEEILGTLRYQPKTLEIPPELLTPRRRNYFPLLAIAASVLLALIAASAWFRVHTRAVNQPEEARVTPAPSKGITPQPRTADPTPAPEKPADREVVAVNRKRRSRPATAPLPKHEQEEALAAKEQLMIALRLTSEKLSLVHHRTQSPTPSNQIKNQHRIG